MPTTDQISFTSFVEFSYLAICFLSSEKFHEENLLLIFHASKKCLLHEIYMILYV